MTNISTVPVCLLWIHMWVFTRICFQITDSVSVWCNAFLSELITVTLSVTQHNQIKAVLQYIMEHWQYHDNTMTFLWPLLFLLSPHPFSHFVSLFLFFQPHMTSFSLPNQRSSLLHPTGHPSNHPESSVPPTLHPSIPPSIFLLTKPTFWANIMRWQKRMLLTWWPRK